MPPEVVFRVFTSFEEENDAEHQRFADKTPAERCHELAVLQLRRWGELWTSTPMVKQAWWEDVPWRD